MVRFVQGPSVGHHPEGQGEGHGTSEGREAVPCGLLWGGRVVTGVRQGSDEVGVGGSAEGQAGSGKGPVGDRDGGPPPWRPQQKALPRTEAADGLHCPVLAQGNPEHGTHSVHLRPAPAPMLSAE